MQNDQLPPILQWIIDAAAALTPAMLGSAVGQAWSTSLTWGQRVVQWLIGITVSWYATLGLAEWLGLGPFASQAIGFVIAMMAFEVAPKAIAGVAKVAHQIPDHVAKFVSKWTQ